VASIRLQLLAFLELRATYILCVFFYVIGADHMFSNEWLHKLKRAH